MVTAENRQAGKMSDAGEPGQGADYLPVIRGYASRQGDETADQYSYSGKGLNIAKLENRLYVPSE